MQFIYETQSEAHLKIKARTSYKKTGHDKEYTHLYYSDYCLLTGDWNNFCFKKIFKT